MNMFVSQAMSNLLQSPHNNDKTVATGCPRKYSFQLLYAVMCLMASKASTRAGKLMRLAVRIDSGCASLLSSLEPMTQFRCPLEVYPVHKMHVQPVQEMRGIPLDPRSGS